MSVITLNDILIALTRLEAKQDSMMEKLDKLEKATDTHWTKISEIEIRMALLEQRQGPRVHWMTYLTTAIGILAFSAAFVTWVVK